MIAAAAVSRGLGVVTRDVDGFRNTGLRAVNPWNANDVALEEGRNGRRPGNGCAGHGALHLPGPIRRLSTVRSRNGRTRT